MNRVTAALSSGVMVASYLGCTAAPASFSGTHRDAIRDSVSAAIDQFARYSESAQWDSLAALYSSSAEFRFLESGAIQYTSRAEVRSALDQALPGMHIRTGYRDLEVDPVAPGVAMVTALFETTIADTAGPRFQFAGGLSLLWKHEPEGWRIRSGHSSAPVPRGR